MKKTLVALAALAATGAYAQVTITGFFNGSVDMFSVGSQAATRTGNLSETRFTDNSSRIIFGVREDLGGGLTAIGQYDMRIALDAGQRVGPVPTDAGLQSPTGNFAAASGNNHIGLSSRAWGTLRMGRQDIQYTEGAHYNPAGTATIQSHIPLLHSNGASGSIANWSRTPNLLWWESNSMNGVTATLGYSTNGLRTSGGYMEQENEMASNIRSGGTTYVKLNGKFLKNALDVTFSAVDSKPDWQGANVTYNGNLTGASTTYGAGSQDLPDQKGQYIGAKYNLGGGFGVGFANTNNSSTTFAGTKREVTANQYALGYNTGAHTLALTYTKKGNNKSNGSETANSGATATSLVWGYDLSKRTQITAGRTVLSNQSAAANTMFYNDANAIGTYGSGAIAGEKHTATSFGMRHSF